MFDLAIIGGGPAGVAAGVYAARKRLTTLLISESIGGQSADSIEIQNWIGTEKINGTELAAAFEQHLRAYANSIVEMHVGEKVANLSAIQGGFSVETSKTVYGTRAVIIATGGSRRKLRATGVERFENKGVSYCASCDGPLFAGQDVVVVGGGNAGFETAAQLLAYCKSVTLIHRNADFSKADATTVQAVLKHPHMQTLTNSEPIEIQGTQFVEKVTVQNRKTGENIEIPASGVFVEIGMVPATNFANQVVELDEFKRIKINSKNQRTSREGIWAAGDCTDELYHQNNIAAGDGVKALEDAYFWIKGRK